MSQAIDHETRTKMMTALTFDIEKCRPQIDNIIKIRKDIAKEYLQSRTETKDEILKMLFEDYNNLLKQLIGI
jgi:hypothetical protein